MPEKHSCHKEHLSNTKQHHQDKSELSDEQVRILEAALKVYGCVSDPSKIEWLSRIAKVDAQNITSWFASKSSCKHPSHPVTKVVKSKEATKGTTKKAYVKSEREKNSPKKPAKKNSKKSKTWDTGIQPQTMLQGKIHVQKSQCQNPMYSGFEKCRSCINKNGDVCRFRNLRVFQESPKGELIYGPAFQSTSTATQPSTPYSRNKNISKFSIPEDVLALGSPSSFPPEVEAGHEDYLRKTIAPSLLNIVNREIEFMDGNTCYQRAASMGVRQMCDVCLTSIFNGFWLCCVCGMEICLYCFDEWTSRNPKVSMCSYKRTHEKFQMVRISRISLEELNYLRKQLLVTVDNTSNSEEPVESNKREGDRICEAEYLCADYERVSLEDFQGKWRKGETVVIQNVLPKIQLDWSPSYFIRHHESEEADMVDCSTGCTVANMTVGDFFRGFEDANLKPKDRKGKHLIMRIKDWPSDMDFKDKFPEHFVDFMKALPFPEYTQRRGILNLASRLPPTVVPPDLGPKMYNAYGSDDGENGVGTTPLHLDMADAVNLMVYSNDPSQEDTDKVNAGAVWDIYRFQDLPKIRHFLREYAAEIGHPIDDPIHDQIFYLNKPLRQRLFDEYGVQGWRIYQNPGDVVYIPAGCAHQVCNYKNCIKVAMDFVSPENVSKCAELTKEFRLLSQGHRRRQDLLQLESILYYSWLNSEDAIKKRDKSITGMKNLHTDEPSASNEEILSSPSSSPSKRRKLSPSSTTPGFLELKKNTPIDFSIDLVEL